MYIILFFQRINYCFLALKLQTHCASSFVIYLRYVIEENVLFQSGLITVERNINEILQFQHFSRSKETRDFNLLEDNNTYVVRWSIAQIVVIMATTAVQVYFVRKLFDIKTGGRSRI